ncbi:hypothetical protein TREES_T100006647 [Tupaia chinensis]|uniref:Uncharacterized protein n=1 Tax=Tupaia chinensis TaxID=246437 RepID=L9KMB6_TUPCH|nr:hypothetical protein TREES_T100006647 [Tupaia chinensis]
MLPGATPRKRGESQVRGLEGIGRIPLHLRTDLGRQNAQRIGAAVTGAAPAGPHDARNWQGRGTRVKHHEEQSLSRHPVQGGAGSPARETEQAPEVFGNGGATDKVEEP